MALKFTSANSRVDLGTPPSLQLASNQPFTFETWIKFQAFRDYAGIFSKNSNMSSPYTYMLVVHANGTMGAYTGSTWVTSSDVTKALQLNTLYHIAYVYDGSILKYYINQQLVGQIAFTYINNTSHSCEIGSWYSATYYPSAIMDGCRFWNKARTQQELIDNKNILLTGSVDGLLGAWDFQNTIGTTVTDLSINHNNGTIYDCTVESNLVEFSKPVFVDNVDILYSNIWYSDIDNVTVKFNINSDEPQNAKYNVKVEDEIIFEETNYLQTPTSLLTCQIPKSKFLNSGSGSITEIGSVIPTMTSHTSPSGVVTFSTEYDTSNYQAWRVFDKVDTQHGWITQNGVTTGWVAYEFPIEKVITKYRIKSGTYMPEMPKKWNFEGYNMTTGQWDVLDSLSNQPTWVNNNEWREYSIPNKKLYKKYRVNIFENQGGSYSGMNEIEMIESLVESSNKLQINVQTDMGYMKKYEYLINREDRDTLKLLRNKCYPSEWNYYNKSDFNVLNGIKLENLKTQGYLTTSNFNKFRTTGKRKILNCEIEGEKLFYYNPVNMLPTITSYNQNGYIITASTQYDTTNYNAWKAFNKTNATSTDCWITQNGVPSGWLQIELPLAKKVGAFAIANRNTVGDENYSPKDFQLLGSNDGINFIVLKSVIGEKVWKSNDYKFYNCDKAGDYKYYRLNIVSNVIGTTYVSVGKFELFEYVDTVLETVDIYDSDLTALGFAPDEEGNGSVYEYELRLNRFTDVLDISIITEV